MAKHTKAERTTPEQLKYFVEFCAENPLMTIGRNNPRTPKGIQHLWDELAGALNAMRGPTKTAAQWKDTLVHWKNMVRSRARQAAVDSKATGGGPRTAAPLSDLEERAVCVFGVAAVVGRTKVPTMGFMENSASPQVTRPDSSLAESSTSSSVIMLEPSVEEIPATPPVMMPESSSVETSASAQVTRPESLPIENSASSPLTMPEFSSVANAASSPVAKRKRVDMDAEVLSLLRDSVAQRQRIEERNIEAQLKTAAAISEMASAVLALSQAVTSLINKSN